MNIIQVNNCDLAGRRFNGHDLQLSLNELGHQSYQLVLEKSGVEATTIPICDSNGLFIRSTLRSVESQWSINNLINPIGKMLMQMDHFKNADIVHYHLIHNHLVSILDMPELAYLKPSVWTIHDPWMVTGNCIHPRECTRWQTGCFQCPQLDEFNFPMKVDKAAQMWAIKRQVYEQMEIDIVVSSHFMEDYVRNSPLTAHFKKVHKIPFGINVESFENIDKAKARTHWGIPLDSFVISFRADSNKNKGLNYLIEMLNGFSVQQPITILSIGNASLPLHLTEKYNVIELGWQNDLDTVYDFYGASDVFIMPSLAESFGMMAIEAMASGCPIIVFEDTVLPEITFAPECGIAVPYGNSELLRITVERLMDAPEELRWRGERGKQLAREYYQYTDYIKKHISLYQDIMDRSEGGGL
ncbi:glycosyltransferase [Paenibacillus sp. sgz500958]|uniref:glycosyltransferase n=1 Tax=Paenibacillus sp. sgz500958 TaxID=3242475 RepID=UPI0036D3C596